MLRLLAVLSSRRPSLRQGGRALLSVLGIALGVALAYGVHLVNRAAVADVAAAVRELAGEADLEVRGGRSGFPERLHAQVARVPGVAWVKPGLEVDVAVPGQERPLRVAGIDAVRDAYPELLEGDRVVLSTAASQALGKAKGDRLVLGSPEGPLPFEVAGVTALKGALVLMDVSTAQWRFGRLGELTRLDVRLAAGADAARVQRGIAALLPPGVHVAPSADLAEASAYPSRAYRVNMNVLALVALFTGGFLVFSAQALEMARRRGEHAILRVLGLTAPQLRRLVLAEAALLGAAGAALGLLAGHVLALATVRLVGADFGSGTYRGVTAEIRVTALPLAAYFAAGVGIALAGAWFAARDAARSAPARALRAGDEQAVLARVAPAWPGLAALAAGAACALPAPVAGLPVFGYASIACILVGAVLLMPRLSQAAFAVLPAPRNVPWRLAVAQLRGAPGQAAVSLAAIVASFSLMAAMAIMVASFRESVDRWLDTVLPAQLYVRPAQPGEGRFLPPAVAAGINALPEIARADFLRFARVTLDPLRPSLAVIARDRAAGAFPIIGPRHERQPDDPPAVWVSEAVADLYGHAPGARLRLPLGGRDVELGVAGVFRDYARQHGAFLLDRADYVALTGDARVNDAALWLAPGATVAGAMERLRAIPGGSDLEIAEPGEIRALSLRIFDRSFAATYAVEAVAMLVGLFGLSSSLGAIVLARRREFGVLRHLGVTRGQLRAMLAAEGGLLALFGAAAGLGAGFLMSLVLIHVVNRQAFNWGMELHPPWLLLAGLTLVLVALAAATAVLAGREATGMGPVRAVREDW
jgi:putative ABC transport system permease protein